MRIHCLQHVPFETPAEIKIWAENNNHEFTTSLLFEFPSLPDIREIDALVIMGGPMSVNEEHNYPWLIDEKRFIRDAIEANKKILGVCLGAQLIADALGAKIYENKFKEIGWLPIKFTHNFKKLVSSYKHGESLTVFHWHGETFDLPEGAIHLAESEGCTNQAFMFGKNILALQFHLETNSESLNQLINNCRHDITDGKYIQTEEDMIKCVDLYYNTNKSLLNSLLNNLII